MALFLRIWNYLRGYVIVEVSGFAIERFINLAVNNNIYLWDVRREAHKLYFKIGIKDFKKLKPHAKKSRCRVRIKYKKGMPFKTYKYKRRTMFSVGVVIFIGLIWLLSSFVWLVEVEGNSKIDSLDIIQALDNKGYGVGKFKGKLDLRAAEAYLSNQYPEIIWTGIKFQGTCLLVQVSEMVPKPEMHNDKIPCNIVAKRDALVTYIATYKGMPYVKKGDIVKKGELLVAGQMPLGPDDPNVYVTRARAQIKGKTIYSLSGDYALDQVDKHYTERTSKKYSLKMFNQQIPLINQEIKFKDWDRTITSHQLTITKFFPLPFAMEVEERIEYIPTITKVTEEEAKDKLTALLWDHLSEKLSEDAIILKRDMVFVKKGNAINGVLHVIAHEDIGYLVELHNEGEN